MLNFLKLHLHPLGGRIIFWNFILFLLVKFVFPYSSFPLASLIDTIPVFDSREVIKGTNEARLLNNLPPLAANPQLDIAAANKLNDMAVEEYFAHVSPDGTDPWFWLKQAQYKYSVAGENLAIGFSSAGDTVRAWLDSPSHRANILNGQYQEVGVAVKGVKIGEREGLLVVQMFGRPLNSSNIVSPPVVRPASPTPAPVQVAVIPSPGVVEASQTKVTVQEVSTDRNIEPVATPFSVPVRRANDAMNAPDFWNNAYSVYALVVAGLSAFAFFILERNKAMALRMSLNFALFVLSVVVPMIKIASEGWIF